jgi:hypothetical protein
MATNNTGYLYNWGLEIPGFNSIPPQITGVLFSGVNAGYNLNAAQSVSLETLSEIGSSVVAEKKDPDFKFQIYGTNYSKIPIKKVDLESSFTGTPTGGQFVSGNDFTNKLVLITKADGDNLVNSDLGVLSLGQTLGTGDGEYVYPQDTFLNVKKNNLNYADSDSWIENFNKLNSYGFINYKDAGPLSTIPFNLAQKLSGDSANDQFGHSVATNTDGSVIVMGGIGNDGGTIVGSGAALVFTGNSTVGWTQKQKLSGDSAADQFGHSVATNGDGTVIVMGGIGNDNGPAVGSGAAFVFTGNSTVGWTQKQKLSGDSAQDEFGHSVATNSDGTVIVMGGRLDDPNGISNAGSALVFTGNSTVGWTQAQKLSGDSEEDRFGYSVATNNDGSIIVMGGIFNDGGALVGSGAVLVFTGNSTVGWTQKQKLSGDSAGAQFGRSVATNGDGTVIVMGGPLDDNGNGTNAGAALVFTGNSTVGWTQAQKLSGDSAGALFGFSVTTNSDGTVIVMGGRLDDPNGISNAGSALVFTGSTAIGWTQKQKLSGDSVNDLFGQSVATNGDGTVIVMGGIGNDGGAILGSGAAMVFRTYTPFATGDAGIVLTDIGGRFLNSNPEYNIYEINYGTKEEFLTGTKVKQNILFEMLGTNYPSFPIKKSSNETKVWASYDVETGMEKNSKNVFSYSVELIDKIKTTIQNEIIFSNASSKNEQFSGYKNLLTPIIRTGIVSSFIKYSGFCFASLECPEIKPAGDDPPPIFECFTGESIESQEYQIFVSGVKKKYQSNELNARKEYDFASADYLVDKPVLTTFFSIQTGELVYNSFSTGDTINFSLYGDDYETLYKDYHLGNSPTYPNTGFSLTFPNDFSNIDSLVDKLNLELSGISYPVWYPYDCLKGEASGIYITGGLMSFYKDTGILSGLNYNNIIKFESLRNYPKGFNLSLNLVNRDEFVANYIASDIKKGFSYLIPDVIELQGFTTGINGSSGWVILDRQSGLYHSITGLKPKFVPVKSFSDSGLFSDEDLVEPEIEEEDFSLEEVFQPGKFELIESFTQNRYTKSSAPEYCAATNSKSKEIEIYHRINWPIDWTGCPPQPPEEKDEGGDDEENGEGGGSSDSKNPFFFSILRTGWLLNPTGEYLSCLTAPHYTPLSIAFDKYRVVARNFSGLAPLSTEYLIPKNEIYFANLNLFSAQEDSSPKPFSGTASCLVGADFTADVQDFVKVPFYQNYEYTITEESRSGLFKVLNQPVIYTPSEEMRNIKFLNLSGKIIGDITGFITATFTGTGFITEEFTNRRFYNPNTKEIYFQEVLTKYVTGSGQITGSSTGIKEAVVNRDNGLGVVRFVADPFYKNIVSNNFVTGSLLNQRYEESDVLGFYFLTGTVTGLSNSGYFNYVTGVTGLTSFLDSGNLPYYPVYTGVTQATGIINFNFNQISNFDSVAINNFSITYHSDSDNFSSPSFFNSVQTLNTIINNGEINFACTSEVFNNTGILLKASTLYSIGDSGNSISTSANGSGIFALQSFLSGGKTFYPVLKSVPGDTRIFSGTASNSVGATGFYYEIGSGSVLGDINSFGGVREFSGIWGIKTGQNFNLAQLLLESGNRYINSGNFGINNILFLNLTYNNQLNISDSTSDVVQLKIKDNNFTTAYSQGYIKSGVTGELIFRITGTRNL